MESLHAIGRDVNWGDLYGNGIECSQHTNIAVWTSNFSGHKLKVRKAESLREISSSVFIETNSLHSVCHIEMNDAVQWESACLP